MFFSSSGFGDGQTYAFWPMLIGGFFLYISYYGCDQSQTQRLLTTSTIREAQKSLWLNGLLRFPLVLTYCVFGVFLIPFLATHQPFAQQLEGQPADYLVPLFRVNFMPQGFLGLLEAGIFAASMSTIDSAMNSLSAVTYRDILIRIWPRLNKISDRQQILISRLLTIFWGVLATFFALSIAGSSKTVIELVNQIGSVFYGPILAVFCLGMFSGRASEPAAIVGFLLGLGGNVFLWQFYEKEISWMWWNLVGFSICLAVGWLISVMERKVEASWEGLVWKKEQMSF